MNTTTLRLGPHKHGDILTVATIAGGVTLGLDSWGGHVTGTALTAAEARDLAAALIAHADLVDAPTSTRCPARLICGFCGNTGARQVQYGQQDDAGFEFRLERCVCIYGRAEGDALAALIREGAATP